MEIVHAGKGVRSEVRRGPGNEKTNIKKTAGQNHVDLFTLMRYGVYQFAHEHFHPRAHVQVSGISERNTKWRDSEINMRTLAS